MTSYNQADIPPILNTGVAITTPAIFVHAHQDDETLTFGAEIEAHKAAGRYILSVCATDGRASTTRVLTGLDVPSFVRARNLELFSAASALGIDEVYLEGGQDAALAQAQADALAAYWTQRYPTGSFKVPSDLDDNADHRALGVAFRKIKNARPSADIRFYVKPEQRSQVPGARITTAPVGDTVRAAALEYQRLDMANGRYAIGYQSVPFDFVQYTSGDPIISAWHF